MAENTTENTGKKMVENVTDSAVSPNTFNNENSVKPKKRGRPRGIKNSTKKTSKRVSKQNKSSFPGSIVAGDKIKSSFNKISVIADIAKTLELNNDAKLVQRAKVFLSFILDECKTLENVLR